jgi:hypothetical protein
MNRHRAMQYRHRRNGHVGLAPCEVNNLCCMPLIQYTGRRSQRGSSCRGAEVPPGLASFRCYRAIAGRIFRLGACRTTLCAGLIRTTNRLYRSLMQGLESWVLGSVWRSGRKYPAYSGSWWLLFFLADGLMLSLMASPWTLIA